MQNQSKKANGQLIKIQLIEAQFINNNFRNFFLSFYDALPKTISIIKSERLSEQHLM